MHLEDLARWRQLVYRLFSSTLLYPDEGRLKTITAVTASLHKQSDSAVRFSFFPQWQRLLTSLADLPNHHTLEEKYVRVFMHSPEGAPCLPYESVYVDPGGQAAGWIVAMLEREYAAAGLAISPSLKDLPDHVAVELEFMASLCRQEADAWNRKVLKEGVQTLECQANFLDRHLSRWLPEWARQVTIADGEGIYSVVAETARAFISHDQDLIDSLLDQFQRMPEAAQARGDGRVALEKQPRSGGYRHAL
ncbi:MAG: molecular chaperone [Dehalococcoidales bacterium]